ncbi:MAG: VWA domain-containing protein [Bacteroidales bacterium]|nr:VWA domain-containing protein [Bacteroidales bacterium]
MNSFRFEHTEFLYLLLLLPVIVFLFWLINHKTGKALAGWMNPVHKATLMPMASNRKKFLKLIIFLTAFSMVVLAVARPQFGSKLTKVKRKGVEIMIAVDVSNSMLAEDIQPNRLANAKRAISRLIEKLDNDKIGLIVFAGDAYVQLPITTDFGAAKLFLSSVNTDIVPRQGTSIGAAIKLASKSFSPDAEKSKAIIIITDGENHEDGAVEAATAAAEKGITVHTIGMGLPKGAPIPIINQFGQKDYRKDHEGNVVITKLDEKMLREIALAGKGVYIRASNSRTGLNTLFKEINNMQKQDLESRIYSEYEEQFQYPIAAAILLLIIEFLLLNRKNRLFTRLSLVGRNDKAGKSKN